MITYCYKCRTCGTRWEGDFAGRHCDNPDVVRDYRAESSNVWTFTNALGDGKVSTRVVGEGGAEREMP